MSLIHEITPGRIITAEQLQAQGLTPAIILRNDFGIAAIKSRRAIPPDVSNELATLTGRELESLNHRPQIHYDPDHESKKYRVDDGIPPLVGAFVQETLTRVVDRTGCRGGRASFVVGEYLREPLHIDHNLMANQQLTPQFGMVGYSFNRGKLKIKDSAGYIDMARDELEERIEAGDVVRDQLKVGELFVFNQTFAHESNRDAPVDANHIRAMMVLTPRTY